MKVQVSLVTENGKLIPVEVIQIPDTTKQDPDSLMQACAKSMDYDHWDDYSWDRLRFRAGWEDLAHLEILPD